MINLAKIEPDSYVLEGIDTKDYPDFCDAYVSYAKWRDGTELTDEELDQVNDNSDWVYGLVWREIT